MTYRATETTAMRSTANTQPLRATSSAGDDDDDDDDVTSSLVVLVTLERHHQIPMTSSFHDSPEIIYVMVIVLIAG